MNSKMHGESTFLRVMQKGNVDLKLNSDNNYYSHIFSILQETQ